MKTAMKARATATAMYLSIALPGCLALPAEDDADATPSADDIRRSLENRPPVADAGNDITAGPGERIILDANRSRDLDGDRLTFVWTQVSGDLQPDLSPDPFGSIVTFTAPEELASDATLVFTLTVIDGFAADFDQVRVTIRASQ